MTLVFILHDQADRLHGLFPCIVFNILEREHNNRINTLHGSIFLPAQPDVSVCKISGSIVLRFFKECLDRIDRQCFAETARTCKQGDHVMTIDQIPDQERLIHVIALTGHFNI